MFVITSMDMSRDTDAEIAALLPLAPAFLHILIALGDSERHGYSIMQDVANRTETAMPQARAFLAMQLALEAHRIAVPLAEPAGAEA